MIASSLLLHEIDDFVSNAVVAVDACIRHCHAALKAVMLIIMMPGSEVRTIAHIFRSASCCTLHSSFQHFVRDLFLEF